ncbi:MAG: 3-oxoacyl-ACP synthase III family protein [Planctomycetota bacterium]
MRSTEVLDLDHYIHIAGTGMGVPEEVVSNEALEDLVRNYDPESGPFTEWVDRVTHIQTRRILDQDGSAGDMAREAARIALETSGVDPAEIGLYVMATFTAKNMYPGEETKLVDELGLNQAAAFYLTAACAGGVYGLQVAFAFLRAGIYRHALVVGAEHLTAVTDYDDPMTAIIFGDGAGAAVLSARDEPGAGGVSQRNVLSSQYVPGNIMMENNNVPPRERELIMNGSDGPRRVAVRDFLKMEGGPRVLRVAVNAMAAATVESLGFTMKDLKSGNEELRALLDRAKIIPHQANGRILDGLRDKLGVRDEQIYKTIYRYGNISAASNLLTLDYAMRRGNMLRVEKDGLTVEIRDDEDSRIVPGDLVAIPTVGAGYRIGCFTFVHD